MEHSDRERQDDTRLLDYLRVDEFVKDLTTCRALKTAFELGLIDVLQQSEPVPFATLQQAVPARQFGLKLLVGLLLQGNILEGSDGSYCLTSSFRAVLPYRDLLLIKLDFIQIASVDFIELFSLLVTDPLAFMQRSCMFRLFDYRIAQVDTAENRLLTERWMRITTMLTRYEAPVCFSLQDFAQYRRMLDIGGNSGEYALQACRNYPELQATVVDLPVVCAVGSEFVSHAPEADRVRFLTANARSGPLPGGHDLITFKSMLHDWPDDDVCLLLHNACEVLEPGGLLLIFERGPFEIDEISFNCSSIPLILFAHTLRSPNLYLQLLERFGLQQISVQWITLDMPFFLVTGTKPRA
jgi:SAM-dependent methyltransferase